MVLLSFILLQIQKRMNAFHTQPITKLNTLSCQRFGALCLTSPQAVLLEPVALWSRGQLPAERAAATP